jgi:hypothetical protein
MLIYSHSGGTHGGIGVEATGPGKIFIAHPKVDDPSNSRGPDMETDQYNLPTYSELFPFPKRTY